MRTALRCDVVWWGANWVVALALLRGGKEAQIKNKNKDKKRYENIRDPTKSNETKQEKTRDKTRGKTRKQKRIENTSEHTKQGTIQDKAADKTRR